MSNRAVTWILIICGLAVALVALKSRLAPETPAQGETQSAEVKNAVTGAARSTDTASTLSPTASAGTTQSELLPSELPRSNSAGDTQMTWTPQAPKPGRQISYSAESSSTRGTFQPEPGAEILSLHPNVQQRLSDRYAVALEKLAGSTDNSTRAYALGDAAKLSLLFGKKEEAGRYADELLALIPTMADGTRDGQGIHDGNLVLGRIAVQEGRMDDAKQYLLNAGAADRAPVLSSFGPNMALARDLIAKGETEAVLQYLELCRKFWDSDGGKLDRWTQDIQSGRTPDFGVNLVY